MWYKKDRETIVIEGHIEPKEEYLFSLLKNVTLSPVTSASLYIKDKYVGILSDFALVTVMGGNDITILNSSIVLHIDKIEIIFNEQNMKKVMEILQDETKEN